MRAAERSWETRYRFFHPTTAVLEFMKDQLRIRHQSCRLASTFSFPWFLQTVPIFNINLYWARSLHNTAHFCASYRHLVRQKVSQSVTHKCVISLLTAFASLEDWHQENPSSRDIPNIISLLFVGDGILLVIKIKDKEKKQKTLVITYARLNYPLWHLDFEVWRSYWDANEAHRL